MLSVIYPAFNEEENLRLMKKELLDHLDKLNMKYEVIIIDDGSKDSTFKEATKLAKKYKAVKVVKHPKNMGLGMAVRTGIANSKGDLIVTIDGDYTFHPKLIKNLLARFNKGDVDCVIGSPTLEGYDKSVPGYRIFLSKSANALYNILLMKRITAVTPIFRVYRAKNLKALKLTTTSYDINAEILAKLIMTKARVVEIPARLTVRKHGVSKINNVKEIKNHIKLLSKMLVWRVVGVGNESRSGSGHKA